MLKTDLFNSTESKPHFINDRCFGEDLLAWIVAGFPIANFVFDEPFQEDWGWATLARRENEVFSMGVGILDESIGKVPAEWMVAVEKKRRFIKFGAKKSPHLSLLADTVEKVLRGDERVTDVSRSLET